ncbi:hypothetical protein VF14_31845 [Nostoc linckia z18]|uniref:Uncharacterized protein n=2 Tax=Nostoc linckia TaxID=92942 RepID=A0A9Q6EHQ2_NOSLI|nr:hypothetical protein VF02_35460 [Nostoc linckia z1]PHJ57003.1 hypothetical protein VF05_36480 [Nostoc linckia z3]PHJ58297.1 hypothetical protein VF03_35665 [Nostoc linckia z2]PHJ73077.1 hypothetical protein VF06_36255 [Nostoc linckia z4]PHJ77324.1 hypothetical protein VF07_36185 [Nostoc linckia z6]PHJ88752.1 hypothetical protein VF04_33065 [Nostoc linckia z7]PHJ95077.1 hypothetical protein VF08_32700 [Nostoc linckia z8]PHK03096.1 hypothetical protein VF09_30550 [Nostoc linckia z9]PHK1452
MKNIELSYTSKNIDFYHLHQIISDLIEKNGTKSEFERFKFNLERLHNDYPPNSDRNLNQFSSKRNAEIFESYIGKQKVTLNMRN